MPVPNGPKRHARLPPTLHVQAAPPTTMGDKDNVYMAKLAEQAERYEEMVRGKATTTARHIRR